MPISKNFAISLGSHFQRQQNIAVSSFVSSVQCNSAAAAGMMWSNSIQSRSYAKKKGRGSGVISTNPKRFAHPRFLKRAMRQWLSSRKRNVPHRRRRIKTQLEEIALKEAGNRIFDHQLQQWLQEEEERRQMRKDALTAIDCPNLKKEALRRTNLVMKNAAFARVPTDLPPVHKWKSSFLQYHLKELEEVHEKKQKQRELLSAK